MTYKNKSSKLLFSGILSLLTLCASAAYGHGNAPHAQQSTINTEQMAWGVQGDPKRIDRTIDIQLKDSMRFEPQKLNIKLGETIQFKFTNTGKILHEWVLGTAKDLAEHAVLMQKFPDMEHDAPYMVHVKPGQTQVLVWRFNRAGTFEFACLLPGHYTAGMKGVVVVSQK